MSSRVEQKKRSHESILRSASRLLRQRGISGARVAEVMQGAALTVGGFYAHFASKDALVDETLRATATSLRKGLFAGLDEKPEGDRVDVVMKRYLSAAHRDATTLGCPFPAVVGEVGTTAPQHRPILAEQVQALIDGVAGTLPSSGVLPRRALAVGLVALMYGGLSLARAVKGTGLSDEVLRACRTLASAAVRGGRS